MSNASSSLAINLLPISRRMRNARSAAMSRWLSVVVLLAVGSYIPAGAMALGSEDDLTVIESRIQRSQEALLRIRSERPSLEAELLQLRNRAVILDAVESGIDWLPLLGAMSEAAHPARFDQIELNLNQSQGRIDIRMVGLVETQSDARALVLRLEQIEPLSGLKMTGTKVAMEREVYRFDIAATVKPDGVR
jgi:hypothetical protein